MVVSATATADDSGGGGGGGGGGGDPGGDPGGDAGGGGDPDDDASLAAQLREWRSSLHGTGALLKMPEHRVVNKQRYCAFGSNHHTQPQLQPQPSPSP